MTDKVPAQAYKELIAQTVDVLTPLDESGIVQYASPSVKRIVGYEPSELEGETIFDYIHPDDQQKALDTFHEIVEADEGYTTAGVELRFQHKDGSWIWLESRGSNQLATELDAYVVSSRDISTRKEYERQLMRERDRLDQFASVVSHDLRNPLQVAEGRLELAQHECGSDHLEDVARAHDRMESLIENLLTLARQGARVDEVEAIEIAPTVNECWANVSTPEATVVNETTQTIQADPPRLKQLLENLFSNAVEHGGDNVTVTVGDLADPDGFYIADDGPGIDPDDRDDVFNPGYSTGAGGTGLGLNIVKENAEAHGWNIDVTESEDGGARFEVSGVDTV